MKTNIDLQKDVQDELKWDPMLTGTEIGATVSNGTVTLTGHVDSYSKKLAAERAAKRVAGVKAVAQEIEVKLSDASKRSDTDIANAALTALKWNSSVPDERIKLKVEDGWVYLEGELDWQFQKDSAKTCVEDLIGVKGVRNLITIKPRVNTVIVKGNITKALHRNASVEANNISIETSGNKVTLKGTVHSFFERKEVEKAAWAAPGVIAVEDKLLVAE